MRGRPGASAAPVRPGSCSQAAEVCSVNQTSLWCLCELPRHTLCWSWPVSHGTPWPRCQPCSQSLSGPEVALWGATSHLPPHILTSLPVSPHYLLTASPATHWQLTAQGRAYNHSNADHGEVLLLYSPAPGGLLPVWLRLPAGEMLRSCDLRCSFRPWLLQHRQQPVSYLLCGLLLLLTHLHPDCFKGTRWLGLFPLQQPWSTTSYPRDPESTLLQVFHGIYRQEIKVQVSWEEAPDGQREGEAEDEGSDQGSASPQDIPPTVSGPCRTDPDQDRDAAPHHPLYLLPVGTAGPQRGGAGAEEILGLHGAEAPNPRPLPGSANSQLQPTTIKLWYQQHSPALPTAAHISGMYTSSLQSPLQFRHIYSKLLQLNEFLTKNFFFCFVRFLMEFASPVSSTGCRSNKNRMVLTLDSVETYDSYDSHLKYIHCNNDLYQNLRAKPQFFVILNKTSLLF